MGVVFSILKNTLWKAKDENSEEKASLISRSIDISIKKENWDRQNLVKLLLLGPSEAGKSTLLRQLTLIKGGGYTVDERNAFKPKMATGIHNETCSQTNSGMTWMRSKRLLMPFLGFMTWILIFGYTPKQQPFFDMLRYPYSDGRPLDRQRLWR